MMANKSHQPQPGKPETTTPNEVKPNEDKHSFNWGWIVWPLVVLFLYVFSLGPVAMMIAKKRLPPSTIHVYAPVGWVYEKTFFHKPVGLYLHLWAPEIFNKNGDLIGH